MTLASQIGVVAKIANSVNFDQIGLEHCCLDRQMEKALRNLGKFKLYIQSKRFLGACLGANAAPYISLHVRVFFDMKIAEMASGSKFQDGSAY